MIGQGLSGACTWLVYPSLTYEVQSPALKEMELLNGGWFLATLLIIFKGLARDLRWTPCFTQHLKVSLHSQKVAHVAAPQCPSVHVNADKGGTALLWTYRRVSRANVTVGFVPVAWKEERVTGRKRGRVGSTQEELIEGSQSDETGRTSVNRTEQTSFRGTEIKVQIARSHFPQSHF